MVNRVPLSRAAQLLPFLDFLDRLGARTELALERSKLPPGLLDNADTLIGTRAMSAFVGDMARREAIPELGWLASDPLLTRIPVMARQIRSSQTLLQALRSICALGTRESSNLRIWIEEREGSILFCYRGSVDVGAAGADELSQMQAAVLLSIVRLFAAPEWGPTECALAMRGELGPIAREELGDASIHRTSDYSWFRLPRSILSRPLRAPPPRSMRAEAGIDPAQELADSLVQLLRPYLSRGAPPLRYAAELAGTSARSLQRALAREGSSYRDIVLRAKFETARALLQQPSIKIVEVSYETGFSDPAHFTRFFRSIAGESPREYRSSVLEGRA